jgi:hypothetical protein
MFKDMIVATTAQNTPYCKFDPYNFFHFALFFDSWTSFEKIKPNDSFHRVHWNVTWENEVNDCLKNEGHVQFDCLAKLLSAHNVSDEKWIGIFGIYIKE